MRGDHRTARVRRTGADPRHHRLAALPRPDVQCGSLSVPLDWARPDGPTVSVAVARNPADDPSQRIGALFLNPGGPGGSAAQFAAYADLALSPNSPGAST